MQRTFFVRTDEHTIEPITGEITINTGLDECARDITLTARDGITIKGTVSGDAIGLATQAFRDGRIDKLVAFLPLDQVIPTKVIDAIEARLVLEERAAA